MVSLLHKRYVPEVLIVLLTCFAYATLPWNVFVDMDDQLLIIYNQTAHGLSLANIKAAFTTYDPELYIPLTFLTYQLEYSLFGLQPGVTHVVSLLLHICSSVLLLQIFRRFFSLQVAFILSLLFALHPINTEAVAWASGRKDVLSSMFFLLSLQQYLRCREQGRSLFPSIGAFFLGLLSKVSIAPLPIVLLLVDWVQGRTINKSVVLEKLPYFLLTFTFVLIALLGKPQTGQLLPWVLLAFVGIPFYLRMYIAPYGLSMLYPFADDPSITHPWVIAGIVVVSLLTVFTLLSYRKTKVFVFAYLWFSFFIGISLPNVFKGAGDIDMVQLYFASDRYVYLAGIALLYLFGVWLSRKPSQLRYRFAICVCAVFFLLTFRQVSVWRDSVSVFTNVLATGRQSHVANLRLARIAGERGDLDTALSLYQASNDIRSTSKALLNIGQIYALQGDQRKAIETYQQVLEKWPDLADVHEHIGALYLKQGRVDQAVPYILRAIELDPTYVPAYFNLGAIFEAQGQIDDAIAAYRKVLELKPDAMQAQEKLREYDAL